MPRQQGHRFFTVQDANDALPQLRVLLGEVMDVGRALSKAEKDLDIMIRGSRTNGHSTSDAAIALKRNELSKHAKTIEDLVTMITGIGIILRDVNKGLVDFPATRDGREIYLCWVNGEERVAFWHPLDSGYSSRQPL